MKNARSKRSRGPWPHAFSVPGLLFLGLGVAFVGMFWVAGAADNPNPVTIVPEGSQSAGIDFAHEIVPILRLRCAECHAGGRQEGGLSLNTRESLLKSGVVVPGNPDESELVRRITSDDPDERMPPSGAPLSKQDQEKIRAWIAAGLPWDEGFSFAQDSKPAEPSLALAEVVVPPVQGEMTHPIDRLVLAYFEQHQLPFPQLVDDRQFLRRVGYDLVGLPPNEKEISEFLADSSPDRRERWIRRLLDDKTAYADHWLSFWNDLLRNDYTGTGYIDGGRKQISNWLYRALYNNMPYNQFVQELVAPSSPEAEGFIRGIKWRGNVNASQRVELQFAQTTAQVFLGINMKCASCHDSFIDRWKLSDAYGLAAITAEEPLEIHRCDKPLGEMAQARFLYPELGDIDPSLPREERLKQYAELLTKPENGRTSRTIVNRIWHRLMGRGLVHPVDSMSQPAWSPELLDYLARYLIEHNWDLKELMFHICSSRIYQAECDDSYNPLEERFVFRGPLPKRLTAEQFCDTIWRLTGAAPSQAAFNPSGTDRQAEFVRASLTAADAFQLALGRPQRDVVVSTRPEVVTTLQALNLSIGGQLHGDLQKGAQSLIQRFADQPVSRLLQHIYLVTLTREPSDQELSVLYETLHVGNKEAPCHELNPGELADVLWIIVMLPEFQTIR